MSSVPVKRTASDEEDNQERNSFHGNDPRVVDYHSQLERDYWCKVLDATPPELLSAILAVGISAQQVKDWLLKKRSATD